MIHDVVNILNSVYTVFIENYGEEAANELFAKVGRVSTVTDKSERSAQIFKLCEELIMDIELKGAPSFVREKMKSMIEEMKDGKE